MGLPGSAERDRPGPFASDVGHRVASYADVALVDPYLLASDAPTDVLPSEGAPAASPPEPDSPDVEELVELKEFAMQKDPLLNAKLLQHVKRYDGKPVWQVKNSRGKWKPV